MEQIHLFIVVGNGATNNFMCVYYFYTHASIFIHGGAVVFVCAVKGMENDWGGRFRVRSTDDFENMANISE